MRTKRTFTPTGKLILSYLSDPATPTPLTNDSIATALDALPTTVRVILTNFVREGILKRTLRGHTAYFEPMPDSVNMTRTEIAIPGTSRTLVRYVSDVATPAAD
jgi:hypothetical protein